MVISSLLSLSGGNVAYGVPGSGLLSHRYQGASKSRCKIFSDDSLSLRSSNRAILVNMFAIGSTSKDNPGSTASGRSEYAIASAADSEEISTSFACSGIADIKH